MERNQSLVLVARDATCLRHQDTRCEKSKTNNNIAETLEIDQDMRAIQLCEQNNVRCNTTGRADSIYCKRK